MASSTLGRSCGSYGLHLRARFPSPSPPTPASVSSSSTCRTTISAFSSRMRFFSPPLLSPSPSSSKELGSRRFVHRLSASQEGSGSSNEAPSVGFPPQTPPHSVKKDSSKLKKASATTSSSPPPPSPPPPPPPSSSSSLSSSQIDLVQTLKETSSPPPSSPARKVTRKTTKKKENLTAEIDIASISEESSLAASSTQKVTRKKKETSFSSFSTQTEISSASEESSSALVLKKVTRKRKKDVSSASQSLTSPAEDHSSEITLTSNDISLAKRASRKKKYGSTVSHDSASSEDQKDLSSFTLNEPSESLSAPMSRSRRKKGDGVYTTDNHMKDVAIISTAVLEETSLPMPARKVSRKEKNDALPSLAEVHITPDSEIVSSVAPNKLIRMKKNASFLDCANEVTSFNMSIERNMQGDGNTAENIALSTLMLPKKVMRKKEKHVNTVAETSEAHTTPDREIISSASDLALPSPKKSAKGNKNAGFLDHSDDVTSSPTLTKTVSNPAPLSPLMLLTENSKKEKHDNVEAETNVSYFADGSNAEYNNISPKKERESLPIERGRKEVQTVSVLDDHITSIEWKLNEISNKNTEVCDKRPHEKSSLMKENSGSSFEFERKITLARSNKETEMIMPSVSSVISSPAPLQKIRPLNIIEEDDLMFSDREYTNIVESSDNNTSTKPTSVSGPYKRGESFKSEPVKDLQKLNEKAQPSNAMHSRSKNEDQKIRRNGNEERVKSAMEGKFLIKNGRVNGNQKQAKEKFYGNDYQAAKFSSRNNEKFGNPHSHVWRSNLSYKESTSMDPKRAEVFQESERYSQGNQYMVNTQRARGMDRKERKQFSVRNVLANQASTTSYMQIYGTGFDTGDTVPTVFLFFDRRRFIFNVGEGLLRFCMENRFKPSKIDHVFLTRVCSETTGGLPGLILTMAELGESGMAAQTWGPSNLQDLGKALRTFVPSGWLEHAHCFGPEDPSVSDCSTSVFLMEDELIKISAVILYPENISCGDEALENASKTEISCGYNCPSTVYICELSEVKGKFDPAKALAKGLKPGYKYGKLQKGESVVADDGITMVHPDDVLGPSCPGPIMILVDCPSLSYLPSLMSSKALQSYFSDTGKVVNCMIHISPISVTSSKEYQCWMEKFNDTHHIMANQQLIAPGKPTLRCSAVTLLKLNFVCPQLFPMILPESQILEYKRLVDCISQEEDTKICVADNLLKFRFRPLSKLGPDNSDVPSDLDSSLPQSAEAIKAREISQKAFERWSRLNSSPVLSQNEDNLGSQKIPACLKGISREEMEFIFLGTGSSQPSRHRNVTSIYVHLFKHGGILLDCGEGTYAQLKRRYGREGADGVLMGLKLIWISHMHADHFMGLMRVLSARRKLLEEAGAHCERLLVIGPKQLKVLLDAYGALEDLLVNFLDCSQTTFDAEEISKDNAKYDTSGGNTSLHKKGGLISVPSENGYKRSGMQQYWMYPGFHIQQGVDTEGRKNLRRALNSLGLKDLFSIPVVHCPNAFAVVIQGHGRKLNGSEMERGWKLVFSGDTRPCRAVIKAAQGATVLIHEATFDDGMLPEAVKKNHSITKEAIDVGVAAGVYRIFLTHFSQRYPAVPVFDTSYNDITSIAFDMMTVNLADLPVVPQLLPAFRLLFSLPPEDEDPLTL